MLSLACQRLLLVLALAFGSAPLVAAPVEDIYNASVAVADQGEVERQRGIKRALAEVMVKLVGKRSILGDEGLVDVLSRANDYVVGYGYAMSSPDLGWEEPEPGSEEGTPAGKLTLQVNFEGNMLQRVLRDLLLPIWPVDRPPVVVWLVQRGASGARFYEPPELDNVIAEVEEALRRRGVPFKLPLYDLQDQMSLNAEQALAGSVAELTKAGLRYGTRHWLVLEVPTAAESRGLIWRVGGDQEHANGKHDAATGESSVTGALDAAIDHFSTAFAFQARQQQKQLAIVVGEVSSYTDFKGLMAALNQLEVVASLRVKQIEGKFVTLELQAGGDAEVVIGTLDTHRNFARIADVSDAGAGVFRYQWRADFQ